MTESGYYGSSLVSKDYTDEENHRMLGASLSLNDDRNSLLRQSVQVRSHGTKQLQLNKSLLATLPGFAVVEMALHVERLNPQDPSEFI